MALWDGWTQQQLESGVAELRGAISSAALKVRFGDREVTYRSLKELEQTLSQMAGALSVLTGAASQTKRVRTTVLHGRSGW